MRILIRADATSRSGIGHVMRTSALAEQVRRSGGEALLAAARLDDALDRRVRALGIPIVRDDPAPGSLRDASWVVAEAGRRAVDWVVADGYDFGASFQHALRDAGLRLLLVDDYGHGACYAADLVLNQNLSADERMYADHAPHTRLLLGPSYALIRSEFLTARKTPGEVPERAARILVTMGGADPDNATGRVAQALTRIADPALVIRVVVGPSNPHAAQLAALAADPRVELVTPTDGMAALFGGADLALAAAGITTLELCFVGVPALLVVLAENQVRVARALDRAGIAEDLGWHHKLQSEALASRVAALAASPERRRTMIEHGRVRVDGRGAERVLAAMAAC